MKGKENDLNQTSMSELFSKLDFNLDVPLEVPKRLVSVGYISNIITPFIGEITHWSLPLILTSWDIQVLQVIQALTFGDLWPFLIFKWPRTRK